MAPTKQKMMPFKVKTTPKIRDSKGDYVKRGQTAMLTAEHAAGYQKLGYIEVSMEHLFDEADKRSESTRNPDAGPEQRAEPVLDDSASGEPDEGGAGEAPASDAGASEAEASQKPAPKRGRGRTVS